MENQEQLLKDEIRALFKELIEEENERYDIPTKRTIYPRNFVYVSKANELFAKAVELEEIDTKYSTHELKTVFNKELYFVDEMITQDLCMPIQYFDVHYVNKCPNLDTKDMEIPYCNIGDKEDKFFLLNDNSIRDPKNLDRVFQYLWSIKEKEGWSHEKEKRMFLGNVPTTILNSKITYEDAGYKVPFPKNCLKRIIIGYNMKDKNVERMKKICDIYGLQGLHLIHVSDKPFDLDIISY